MKKVLVGAGILAALGLLGAGIVHILYSADDEAPIRVKNNTLDIDVGQGQGTTYTFDEEDRDHDVNEPGYSYEPAKKYFDVLERDFFVRVTDDVSCAGGNTATGKAVAFDYGGNLRVRFTRARSGVVNLRTKIRPKNGLTAMDAGRHLQHTGGPGEYLTKVSVGTWSCTLPDNPDYSIFVCRAGSAAGCLTAK